MQLEVDGVELSFTVYGSGQPLVILHGWGDSGDSWYSVVDILQHHYQVFVLDLPGFGASTELETVWGVQCYQAIVLGFLEQMGLESPILLGHSLGGKIACLVAQAQPQVKGLILVAASGVDRPSLKVRATVALFKCCKFFLLKAGSWGQQRLSALRKALGSTDYKDAGQATNPYLQPTLVSVVNHKLFDCLPHLKMPALIIWGSGDVTLPVWQAKIFKGLLAKSYIRIIWEVGHHPQLQDPATLARYVLEFTPSETLDHAAI